MSSRKRGHGGKGQNPLHTGKKIGFQEGDGVGGIGFRGKTAAPKHGKSKGNDQDQGKKDVKRGFSALTSAKKEYVEVVKRTKAEADEQDYEFGFENFTEGPNKIGWMVTYAPVTISDSETGAEVSGVDYYFIQQDGSKFKVLFKYNPYFYIATEPGFEREIESVLRRKYAEVLADVVHKQMWDLDMPNHLAGLKRNMLQLKFRNVKDLVEVRKELSSMVQRNVERKKEKENGSVSLDGQTNHLSNRLQESVLDMIIDMREYDVPYVMRVAIDHEFFVGLWYEVQIQEGVVDIMPRPNLTEKWGRAEPRVLAFDIEVTKEPLKFPDSEIDTIYMISYMIDGEGFLIVNREIVTEDIDDFDYTPKKEYEGPFTCFNVPNELALLQRFIEHIKEVKPLIFVTYNGDFFDFPFVDARMKKYGLNMEAEIGLQKQPSEEYSSRFACHLDAFHWVNRDSYLPQGSRGLKAVTKHKLGYDPKEIDPEDMLPFARDRPQEMASYSVSDAVATYYLYMQYVHPFIFSLCNIIPMTPGDVLRKGSGTLCETLLQVEAYRGNIVCPNKHKDDPMKMYKGHLIESETYIGGHVEALNSGVFRSDFMYKFNIDPKAIDELIANMDRDLNFAITVEGGKKIEDIEDYDTQKEKIVKMLEALRETPRREENPSIYHLDVAAMYPNIILTNRLQPPAMVTPQTCASCDFFHPEMNCRREMQWQWRGEVFPATKNEIHQVKGQLKHDSEDFEVSSTEVRKRVKDYCSKVYKRTHDTLTELRTAYICQRENSFYIDTVRAFRDRRYTYKGLTKNWAGKLKEAEKSGDPASTKECKGFVVLYDSLQLAHKCILNSFYGYVMRRGARWYSMEMAGVVTHKGGNIIRVARQLVERIGIPLELDTDGIWCCLPQSFPDGIEFKVKGEKKPLVVSYPCSMLNAQTHHDCVNHQYHTLIDEEKQKYAVHSECSILFELDGPYKAMILPAAKEEGKRLKKRYAVFNFDGSLAELKGFELKRRGELQLVKVFQSEVFKRFLDGTDLIECYNSVAAVANQWLDVLDNKGVDLEDEELIDLISESCNMSKSMEAYGERKSMAITTANRIAEFLGGDMIKDKGLACKYVVSRNPEGSPVTERAIPVEIFKAEPRIQSSFLKKWCNTSSLVDSSIDVRSILDWQYYKDRLASSIQKIVTIPAAMQNVENPVGRVPHPDWLLRIVRERNDRFKQQKIANFFKADEGGSKKNSTGQSDAQEPAAIMDIEGSAQKSNGAFPTVVRHKGTGKKGKKCQQSMEAEILSEASFKRQEDLLAKIKNEKITMDSDFETWHSYMRTLWHMQVLQRKRKRLEDGESFIRDHKLPRKVLPTGGMTGFFKNLYHTMLSRHWDILKISETKTPGIYDVWAILEDGSMQKIEMEVPRIFYVNQRFSPEVSSKSTKNIVSRKLPFGKKCYNLEEVTMSEHDYQEHSKTIATEHEDPTVEGLYETQVPLLFRAVMSIGCVTSVNRRPGGFRERVIKGRERPDTISMLDLKFESTTACPYLPNSRLRMRKSFLYQNFSDNDGGARGFVALFAPLEERRCVVWLINRNLNAQRPPLSRFLKDLCQEHANILQEESPERLAIENLAQRDIEFEIENVSTQQEAFAGVNAILKEFLDESPSAPTVLLKQSMKSVEDICQMAPIMNDLPVLEVPAYSTDNEYEPLGWETKAGKAFIKNLIEVDRFFEYVLKFARYSHIPICNISSNHADMATTVSDILFGRLLKNNNYILWASPGCRPDVGSSEMLYAFECDELKNPDANFPGSFRQYCVTMDLEHLPLTAIVHAKDLEDSSFLASATHSDEFNETLSMQMASGNIPLACTLVDETTFCLEPFKFIAYMAESWVNDTMKNSNPHADVLQMHLYNWINSSSSLFYAPAMVRFVHRLMRKAYQLLLARIRSLGAEVIQASFHQLILNLKKTQFEQAQEYCKFLVREINEVPCFQFIRMDPQIFWARLVYMDRYNYAGLQELDPSSPEYEEERAVQVALRPEIDLTKEGLLLRSSWEIADHLPRRHQKLFHDMVHEYLCLPMKYRLSNFERNSSDVETSQPSQIYSQGFTQKRRALGETVNQEIRFTRELFTSSGEEIPSELRTKDGTPHFSKRLFEEMSKEINGMGEYPYRPGSHLEFGSPQLELLKHLCHVFSLDTDISSEVASMKRGLLKLLQVREFSVEAQFKNPARSVILPDVFCSSVLCSASRDIDLCREQDFIAAVVNAQAGQGDGEFRCHQCDLPYDRSAIEFRLVQTVSQLATSYAQQDLRCNKCHRAASLMMSDYCQCSGKFEHALKPSALTERLEALHGVAKFYGFKWLEQEIGNYLEVEAE